MQPGFRGANHASGYEGLDIAKSVFQVHGVDAAGQVVIRRQLKRRYVLAFFEKLPACLVGIEACASSHHWSRGRGRPRRIPVGRRPEDYAQARMAGLGAAAGDDRTPALSAALDGRRPGQSARGACDEPRRHGLPHPRHQCARDYRTGGVVRLLPAGQ